MADEIASAPAAEIAAPSLPAAVATTPPPPTVDDQVNAIIAHESGGDPTAVGDSGLALGMGQMHPEVRAAYGVTPNSTPEQQRAAVKSYFTDLLKKRSGNVDDAVAEYHLGATNYDRDRNSAATNLYLQKHREFLARGGTVQPEGEGEAAPAGDEKQYVRQALADPKFWNLPADERVVAMRSLDPDFSALPAEEQNVALKALEPAGTWVTPAGEKPPWYSGLADEAGDEFANAIHNAVESAKSLAQAPEGVHQMLSDAWGMMEPWTAGPTVGARAGRRAAAAAGGGPVAQTAGAIAGGGITGLGTPAPPGFNWLAGRLGNLVLSGARYMRGGKAATEAAAQTATEAERAAAWAETQRDVSGAATREAQAEATAAQQAASQAGETATAGAEATTQRGTEWADAQRKAAAEDVAQAQRESAAADAEAARAKAAAGPTPEATQRAEAAFGGERAAAVERGGAAAQTELGDQLDNMTAQTKSIYDTAVQNAEAAGSFLDPSRYQALSKHLADVRARLGTLPPSAEEAVANLETKINAGQKVTPSDLANYKKAVDTTFPGRMKSGTEVREMLRSTFSDADREWAQAADGLWRDQIAGREMSPTSLGNLVSLVEKHDPGVVVEKLFADGTKDAQANVAQAIMRRLADNPEKQQALREAFFARLARPDSLGRVDPTKVLAAWDKMTPEFRNAFSNPGAEAFFNVERQVQAEVGRTAAAAETAGERVGEVTKAGKEAVTTAEKTAQAGTKEATQQAKETAAAAEEAATTAGKRAEQVQKAGEKATGEATDIEYAARKRAEAAAAATQAPSTLAKMTAHGLRLSVVLPIAESLGRTLGLSPSAVAAAVTAGEMYLPAGKLAQMLADPATANVLARMMKTPFQSAIVPSLVKQLESSTRSSEARHAA